MNGNGFREQYLEEMGIQLWATREPASESHYLSGNQEDVTEGPDGLSEAQSQSDSKSLWDSLRSEVASCEACDLHKSRSQTVFGVGSQTAKLMVIGEAPGAEEDRRGEPFVGRAGQLLDEILVATGLSRATVYIANILKCRPPGNRDPLAGEVACCEPFLRRQIDLVRPRLILALGRVAAQNLLKTEMKIAAMRGKPFRYQDTDIPVVVTYHPAYLLRSPQEKAKSWQDMKLVRRLLQQGNSQNCQPK